MEKIVIVVGPTAVGKSELAILLAQKLDGEIINADSMQVYQEMNIGVAKPTNIEFNKATHHLYNIISVTKNFSVADFQRMLKQKVEEVLARNKLPIIVGGTGLYIRAFLYNYEFDQFENKIDDSKLQRLSNEELYEMLKKVDPESTLKIHVNNRKRIIRAILINQQSGLTKTAIETKQKRIPSYDAIIVGLNLERELLYSRINQRVDKMVDDGLIKEAQMVLNTAKSKSTALQAIGYKEFIPYFNNLVSLDSTIETIKKNTRNYAKRQLTFFKNQFSVKWFDTKEVSQDDILNYVKLKLKGEVHE